MGLQPVDHIADVGEKMHAGNKKGGWIVGRSYNLGGGGGIVIDGHNLPQSPWFR